MEGGSWRLSNYHSSELLAIRQGFECAGDGNAVLARRSELVDFVVKKLYRRYVSPPLGESQDFCLLALGGYGRRELFPYSDIDLLFLSEGREEEAARREALAAMLRDLWDLRLRIGHSAHNARGVRTARPRQPGIQRRPPRLPLPGGRSATLYAPAERGAAALGGPRPSRPAAQPGGQDAPAARQIRRDHFSSRAQRQGDSGWPEGLSCLPMADPDLRTRKAWRLGCSGNPLAGAWARRSRCGLRFLCATRCFLHYLQGPR